MKRKLAQLLKKWHSSQVRKPLVLRGARQVGKSTLVRLFAEEHGLDLLEVNLERHRDMDRIFAGLDVGLILGNLEAISGRRVGPRTLIFLDEIQATPHALESLRYFFEDRPELPVIAAGSLLEFALSREAFSMPVGRIQYLFLQPMGFGEFLQVVDPPSLEWLESLDLERPATFPLEAHKRLLARQREYLLVGGMPEAVQCFATTRDLAAVTSIQNSILNTYVDDFAKYARQADLADLQRLFRNLPLHLGKKAKYTHLLPDATSAHSRKLLELLIKAQVALPVHASDCAGIPLRAGMNPRILKLYFLDVGLVSRLLGHDWIELQSIQERSLVNEGPLAEQFIAQHLCLDPETPPEMFYWLNENKNANAEVDFVISQGRLILPVEVKAGKSGTLKSLHLLCGRRHFHHAIRFDLSPPSMQEILTNLTDKRGRDMASHYHLHSLPLYAVEKLPALLKKFRLEDQSP